MIRYQFTDAMLHDLQLQLQHMLQHAAIDLRSTAEVPCSSVHEFKLGKTLESAMELIEAENNFRATVKAIIQAKEKMP